jgi:histidinol phosphatase-like enzyme
MDQTKKYIFLDVDGVLNTLDGNYDKERFL